MTDEERYLMEEEEYRRVRAMPLWQRTKWLIKEMKADRDGSVKFNLIVFAIFVAAILLNILLDRS